MLTLLLAAALLAGYLIGRARPVLQITNWAAWQHRPTGLRRAAVWTIQSAENITWLICHPVAAWHAWQIHNNPPPPVEVPVRAIPWPPKDLPWDPR